MRVGTRGSNYPFLASKERDNETGLDYFLARYYSSTQGRFTSPDEFTGGPDELYDFAEAASSNPTFYSDITNPQSLNKYQYCYGNPLRYVDPDGHNVWESLKQGFVGGVKTVANIVMEASPLVAVPNGISTIVTGKPVIRPFEATNAAQRAGMRSSGLAAALIGPGGKIKGARAGVSYLAQRAKAIAGKLKPATRGHTTTAVAEVVNPNGTKEILVGSSERVLRPAQREALRAGETGVSGAGHAEITVLNAAQVNGQTVTGVAASRPICDKCAEAIRQAGAEILSPLKKP